MDIGNDDPTVVESIAALRARATERLIASAELRAQASRQLLSGITCIARAIPLLDLLDGTEHEHFASRLAEDMADVRRFMEDLELSVRFSGPK
jgi:hypothetical protein